MTYTLKRLAEMCRVTEHTIRYYTDIGLPETRDTLYARYQIILR